MSTSGRRSHRIMRISISFFHLRKDQGKVDVFSEDAVVFQGHAQVDIKKSFLCVRVEFKMWKKTNVACPYGENYNF